MSFLHEPGDLARTPLAALLLEAFNLRASGVLSVEHGGGTSRLYLRAGAPVGAQVFAGFRPLGMILLQAGLIDIDALSRSLQQMAETGRPQGEILVSMKAVGRADVDRALQEQQAGYFQLIAALEAGAYAFDAAAPLPEWTRSTLLSPLRTIVDALERPQASGLVASALQPAAGGGVRLASGYAAAAPEFRWTEDERALVARLARPARIEDFFAPSPVRPERAQAMLAALLLLGLAVPGGERTTPAPEEGAGLAAGRVAPAAEEPMTPGTAARRSDPAEARARRQRLLQRAMSSIGVGPFGGRPQPPPGGAGPATPAAPGAAPGTGESSLRKAFQAVAPRAGERSLFARLGLPEGASRDEVKQAYLQLAKGFHPDRFTAPDLADLTEAVKEFFTAVNEAYEILSDERRRAEYVAARHGAAREKEETARVDHVKGDACLRTGDMPRARGFFEAAYRADPRPEYQASIALTLALDPQRRDLARARSLVEESMKAGTTSRALYAAGVVSRLEGDLRLAEEQFRKAVDLDPKNQDAVKELRGLQARRSVHRD
ncbi:MAG TPA: DnaJ domain-containing protein [Anaeromyxobacteraceae bacterium]|nr:DnaJ domain-containing protein [Anaeromyxobacteraceae bacterium]